MDVPFNENAGFDAKVAGPVNAGIELAPIHALALGADVLFSNVVGEEDAASTGLLPLERFNRGREPTLVEPRTRRRAVPDRLRAHLPLAVARARRAGHTRSAAARSAVPLSGVARAG